MSLVYTDPIAGTLLISAKNTTLVYVCTALSIKGHHYQLAPCTTVIKINNNVVENTSLTLFNIKLITKGTSIILIASEI